MNLMSIQIILTLFLLFALSRVYLRFKSGDISVINLVFWSLIFSSAIVMVLFPGLSSGIAQKAGIGRGVDAIIYVSIAALFYLVFRLYVYVQDLKQDITELVRKLALRDKDKVKERK